MSTQQFRATNFRDETRQRIERANAIIAEYGGQKLTARQVYYRFVAADLIPNTPRSYANMTSMLADARYAGLIDWDAIEDRGREPDVPGDWTTIDAIIDIAIRQFRLPRWDDQPKYVELWVEKQALAGVLAPIANRFHVPLMVNKGYCTDPSALILRSDLSWRCAGDIKVGDELLGVDEHVPGPKKHRRLRLTTVEATTEFVSPRVRVQTDRGSIIVSRNHPFLATRYSNPLVHGYYWVHAEHLKPGCRIAYFAEPWREETSWEAGWLAGMYDGEGCLPNTGAGNWISVYQKPGVVEQQLRESLTRRGWLDGERLDKSGVVELKTYSIDRVARLIGSIRPLRMLHTFRNQVTRGRHPAKGKSPATVLRVEPMNDGTVVGIQTSTRTLITEGFVSHNSSASAMKASADRMLEACGCDVEMECRACNGDANGCCGKPDPRAFAVSRERAGIQKEVVVLYLGDHDPSGEDMVRDIRDRLAEFGVPNLTVEKVALNMNQIRQYRPPPNPAKITDSRAAAYIEKFGNQSWELDALPPPVLNQLVEQALEENLDRGLMDRVVARENDERDRVRKAIAKTRKK